jgi:hypothetical protein
MSCHLTAMRCHFVNCSSVNLSDDKLSDKGADPTTSKFTTTVVVV